LICALYPIILFIVKVRNYFHFHICISQSQNS
jgi:hypothetical protein